jgi:hypothetical protein
MKLYVVSTEVDVIVRAESPEKAREVAAEQRASDLMQSTVAADWNATEMMWLPGDWDLDCQPFESVDGDNHIGDSTIRELIEAGEAPCYSAHQRSAVLAKRQEEKK